MKAERQRRRLHWVIFGLTWTAMTIVGVGFSLAIAASYPTERMERRMTRFVNSLGLQGEELLRVRAARGEDALRAEIAALAGDLEVRLWLVNDGRVAYGSEPDGGRAVTLAGKAAPTFRAQQGDVEAIAVQLRELHGATGRWTIAVENPRPSPLSRALEREAQRLVLIVLVAGLVSFLLARIIVRPIQRLREASARIARGDLSVRVLPELGRSSAELVALAHDFDAMAAKLETLLESQRRLLSDVSHELRSPLARLQVALELARQRAGEAAQPSLDRIERDALRLGELISEILALSRLDGNLAGSVEASDPSERVDLVPLVQAVVADVDFEAQGGGRALSLEVTGAELMVDARPELIRRAVENVLRNAVRFSPTGGRVEVRLHALADEREVELEVRDHGPGVPADALGQIFRPFFRVESARDRDSGGVGLGLAIVERAVGLHGGSVRADNHPDGGLVVTMRLPLAPARDAAV